MVCSILISSLLLSQSIVNYPLENSLIKDGPDGTLGSTLTYSNPPQQYTLNYLQFRQSGDQIVFSFDATDYSGLQLKFTGGILTFYETGYYKVFVKVGAGPEVETNYSITSWLFINSKNYTLPIPAADNQANVVVRIVGSFGGATALGIKNVGLTANITTMSVKRNLSGSTEIPYDAPSSTLLDTDFGNLFTNQESLIKDYTIKNTGSRNLIIESITVDPSDQDFTIESVPPSTIAPNSTGNFSVKFAPQNQGLRVANVVIKANVKPNNPFQFQVKGGGKSCNLTPIAIAKVGFETSGDNLPVNYNSTTPGLTGGSSDSPNPPLPDATPLHPSGSNIKLYAADSPNQAIFVRGRNTNDDAGKKGTGPVKLNFGPVDLTEQQEVSINFDVAAFGTQTGNAGVNGFDYVILSVLKKNGNPNVEADWTDKIELRGGANNDTEYTTRSYKYGFGGQLIERNYNDSKVIRRNNDTNKYGQFKLNIPVSELTTDFTFRIKAETGRSRESSSGWKYYNRNLWLIDNVRIEAGNAKVKTWTGTGWTGENTSRPNASGREKVVFAGNYDFSASGETGDLSVCECEVNTGVNLTVPYKKALTVRNKITNLDPTGNNFIVESDANLLQVENGIVNADNITVQRKVNVGLIHDQYNYFGTPVNFASGESFKTIYPGTTSVLYHSEANNRFYNSSGVNVPGRGLALKEPTGSGITTVTANYKGVPQNGKIVLPVTNSNTAITTLGYNLVGNPYPCNIDLLKLYSINGGQAKGNISSTFYFWDNKGNTETEQQGSGYSGEAYATYNALTGNNGTGTSANQLGSSKKPTNIVKVGQGFMTRSLKKGNYSFLFDNSIRIKDYSAIDFLGKESAGIQDDRYWLHLTAPSGITSTIAIVHYAGGNNLFGPEDSRSMGGSDALYSIVESEKIAIDGRSSFSDTDIIPLGTKHFSSGEFTIGLDEKEGIFANGQNIYLKDTQTGIITNLSEGNYTFQANAGESTGRFEIIYLPETVLITDNIIKDVILVYRADDKFVIKSPKSIAMVQVYDLSGKMITALKPNSKEAIVEASYLIKGIYVLRINTVDGEITNKKIIKN